MMWYLFYQLARDAIAERQREAAGYRLQRDLRAHGRIGRPQDRPIGAALRPLVVVTAATVSRAAARLALALDARAAVTLPRPDASSDPRGARGLRPPCVGLARERVS